ncbi:cyanate lyase [Desulfobaculum xiamenense]|uniref:Cyanate lyase n=2 Tax=Desulfobaculum xiamenense TaxID=995050 RepID=A0A846QG60_9BACT|nr:cyanate lyase [Desulfobaculum xiamenense]
MGRRIIRPTLPLDFGPGVPREKRLELWMRDHGLTFKDIAAQLGVHHTWPGKVLVAKTEKLTPERRRQLVEIVGLPEELV